jgi:parallel beta-helix repeat protein
MFAINNEVYKSTRVGGSCQGVSFVVHGLFDQLLIEGNYLHEDVGAVSPTCYGIGLAFGYAEAESFTNVTIRGNMVENFGAIGIAAEGCQNCLIENNVVIHNQSSDITMITNDLGGGSGGDTRSDANIIRNNSLIATGGSDVVGISLGAAGSNHISVNNVLQYTGTGNFDCFRYDLANSAYTKRDNNICYAPNGNLDADGASLVADPLFTSVEAPFDLTPRAPSPARDAGDAELASTVDIDGEERDSSPDIGAYEVR